MMKREFLQQVPYLEYKSSQMRPVDLSRKAKQFQAGLRPSQSLHTRFLKSNPKEHTRKVEPQRLDEVTVCIIFKKKKIEFCVKHKTSMGDLKKQLHAQLHTYLTQEAQMPREKVEKIMKSVVGFESVDGDVNFDYRLSLSKGCIEKTKFFVPFMVRSNRPQSLKYKIYNCLAIGGFSKVYLARSYENGEFYAIKFIRKLEGHEYEKDKFQSLQNEVGVSRQLDHPFLVRLLQAFQTGNFYCLVFEYCPGGQLFYLLKKVKMMNENMAKFYFLQILYGIEYLHSKSIIYRDLKPENILIDADGNCKIVDFGLSKKIDRKTKTFSYCGSAEYMAPEMILRTGHSFGIDYYSLGALLYELVTGLPPYYTKNHEELQQSIICKEISFPSHIELSSEIKDLLERLLKKDEKYRLGSYIGIKEILFHPWIGKIKSNSILQKTMKAPYSPNLQDYNFDTTELGDDEQQFTALVHENINRDITKKSSFYKQYYKSDVIKNYQNPIVLALLSEFQQQTKENKELPREGSLTKLKKNLSKERLKEIVKSYNVLEKLQNHASKERSFRVNNTVEQKRTKQICKLYPYLNYQRASPKKQKEIMHFIQNKIIKVDRADAGKKLKRIKIQRNRIDDQEIC